MGRHLLCSALLLATLSGGTAHAADALDARRADASGSTAPPTQPASDLAARIGEMEIARQESERKQRQIDELTRRNLQQTAELGQRTLEQRWLLTVLFGSITLLAMSAFLLQRLRRSRRVLAMLNSQLQHSLDALRALDASLEQRVLAPTAELVDDGSSLGTVGTARDISERKEVEAAREAAVEEARRLARLRSDFLARMSHELRAPLSAILGFAQNLLDDCELGERATHNVGIIRQSGEHLLALIDDVLDLARIDAGRIELHPEPIDLVQCLQGVADIIRAKADEKGLSFAVVRGAGLPEAVRVDELRLRQVLLNLLSNGVKFTDVGKLTLRASPASSEPTPESSTPAQVRVRFEVEDSGVGMSEAQTARIFEPFEHVGEARRRSTGAGLGLAISRQLVSLMGGEIRVRSREGYGSVFWFELELPVCAGRTTSLPANTRIIGYAGPRRRILVVDDEPILREMVTHVLRAAGFETAQAGDGAKGIELASSWGPDLIVMDLTMPVMDGLQALRLIRKMPALCRIPVLAASAGALTDFEAAAMAAGASALITKPVVGAVLLRRVGELLELELIFGTKAAGAAAASTGLPRGADGSFVVPPAHEIEVLHKLARVGSMRDVLARAKHLESLDPSYGPFAARLRALAGNYQSQALMELLDSHRASPADRP